MRSAQKDGASESDALPTSSTAMQPPPEAGESAASSSAAATLDDPLDASLDDQLRVERDVFDSLFSTRRPKDGWAGLSSGLKSVAKGTAAGVATLIAAPIAGAQQDGVRGLLTGLATGVASAVALPVTGICVGAYQVGRGIVNSGEAFTSAQAGMLWDEDKREWYYYVLDRERQEVEREAERFASGGASMSSSAAVAGERKVKDREYYDLLGVSTNATSVELKKAYYKRARDVHPDRNNGDPAAAQKFQQLSHAYQILSNDQARAAYDRNGKSSDAVEAEMRLSDIDPYVFFAVMFGSDQVRSYIGELWIANKADSLMKDQSLMQEFQRAEEDSSTTFDEDAFREKASLRTEEEMFKQRRRQVECAYNLRERVQPFVDGTMDESEFIAVCQEEAATITRGSFGDIFCSTIGFALEVEATEFVGSHSSFLGVEGQAAKLRKRGYNISNQWKLLGAGITAARAGSQAYKEMDRLQKEQQEKESSESADASSSAGGAATAASSSSKATPDHERVRQATEKIEQSLPAFLELVWAINTQDITRTLREVCKKVFHDGAEMLPLEVRLRRAEGVRILGREFYNMGRLAAKTGGSGTVDAQEIRRRAEVAAMTTLAKAQGQEVTKADAEEMIRQARAMERSASAASAKPNS